MLEVLSTKADDSQGARPAQSLLNGLSMFKFN